MRAPSKPLRILIADDHPLFRRELREDLERGGLEVVAEVSTGEEAVTAALREQPDLCLLDVCMPGDGMTAADAIRRAVPSAKVVLITASPDEDGALAAARAGADGYLSKDMDPRRLSEVVQAVVAGETTYPRRLLGGLLRSLRRD
jgi:DNA-binding NarL/FixJ family response regulator